MTGKQLWEAARDGDAAKVSTMLSTQGAQSFINYTDSKGFTALHAAAVDGLAAVTKQLIAARCNVDLQAKDGFTPLDVAAQNGRELVGVWGGNYGGQRPSTTQPNMVMSPSQSISLLRAVTSTSRIMKALLRCKMLSARGTPESPR
jgi:hypothetical protein